MCCNDSRNLQLFYGFCYVNYEFWFRYFQMVLSVNTTQKFNPFKIKVCHSMDNSSTFHVSKFQVTVIIYQNAKTHQKNKTRSKKGNFKNFDHEILDDIS